MASPLEVFPNEAGFDNFEDEDDFEAEMEPESPQAADNNINGLDEGLEKIINQIAADNVISLRKAFSEMIAKKAGASSSKQSRDFSSQRMSTMTASNAAAMQAQRTHPEDSRLSRQGRQSKDQGLSASLAVIKKILKMDAAVPFNNPVNPVALGVPDYYDVIDTPMDFGTICNNLEKGLKYKSSEDVYKDVERIWENSCKYYKEGDYILELMKPVKAAFLKHWAAVGLYIKEEQATNGYLHDQNPPLDSAVRHAKWMEGCLVSSASVNPSHHQHQLLPEQLPGQTGLEEMHLHRHPSPVFTPVRQFSDEQHSEEQADAIVGTTEIGSSSGKRRGRGPTRCLKLWNTTGRIHIAVNDIGQPISDEAPKLSNFLGTMARDGYLAPLVYSDWRAMPDSNKETMWQKVLTKFDIDLKSKAWVLDSLAKKWRNWKCMLKGAHYNTHTTDEERLADRDERVLPDQWEYLISYWNSEEGEKRSAINKEIRARQKFTHATGTKSFARIREEEKEKRPDGKEPTWAELFILTRTKKDGNPTNEATSSIISQLRECETQEQEALENGMTTQDQILQQLVGNGRPDRLLTYGIDVGKKPTRVEAIRMVSEANAEVHDMKERVSVMEQTCAQMANQMAKMMSMMSSMHSTPNLDSESHIPDGIPLNQVRTSTSQHVSAQSRETRATKRTKHTASASVRNSKN